MLKIYKVIHTTLSFAAIGVFTVICGIIIFVSYPFFRNTMLYDYIMRIFCRFALLISGVRVAVEGLENIDPQKKYIYVANHQSHFDIPACISKIPDRLRMMAKKELFRVPFFGWGLSMIGHIKIDRENRDQAVKSVDKVVERLRSENIALVVYPEGTRSPDGKIHNFKKGAFVLAIKAERDVVPVTIFGSRAILPKKALVFAPGRIKIVIDKPVITENYEVNQRAELAKKVKEIIENRFYGRTEEAQQEENVKVE